MNGIDWKAADDAARALYQKLGADPHRCSIGCSMKTVKRVDIPVIIVWLREGAKESGIPTKWRGYEVVKREWTPALAQGDY